MSERLHRVIRVDDGCFRAISATRESGCSAREQGGRVIFIGNGGSAGIASHLAIDLVEERVGACACFSDASMMSCLANDYGFEEWLAHALRLNARAGDCLVAISSSGRSKNILNAVAKARTMKLDVITLSGMSADNPLRESRRRQLIRRQPKLQHCGNRPSVLDDGCDRSLIGRAEYPAS